MSTKKLVYEHLWCRFGCPIELVSDQGRHFLNHLIRELTTHYVVVHKWSTTYILKRKGWPSPRIKYYRPSSKRSWTKIEQIGMTNSKVHSGRSAQRLKQVFTPPSFGWYSDWKQSCQSSSRYRVYESKSRNGVVKIFVHRRKPKQNEQTRDVQRCTCTCCICILLIVISVKCMVLEMHHGIRKV